MKMAKNEIKQLTGLRGIAAISIAFAHWNFYRNIDTIFIIFTWHNAAVDLFFCLSGFVLCLTNNSGAGQRLHFGDYFAGRIARIYPLYIVSLIFMAWFYVIPTVQSLNYPIESKVRDFLMQILLVNAWPLIGSGVHWNFPAWAVSIQFFLYVIVFPIIHHFPERFASKLFGNGFWVVILLNVISLLLLLKFFDSNIFAAKVYRARSELCYWVPVLRGLCSFVAGWALYILYKQQHLLVQAIGRVTDVITGLFLSVLLFCYLNLINPNFVMLFFPILIFGLLNGESNTARFLALRPVFFLGKISYSIYLCHIPVSIVLGNMLHPNKEFLSSSLYFAVMTCSLLIASTAIYYGIEEPCRRGLRRIIADVFNSNKSVPKYRGNLGALLKKVLILVFMLTVFIVAYIKVIFFNRDRPLNIPLSEELITQAIFPSLGVKGWSCIEAWGVWSIGKESIIIIPVDPVWKFPVKLMIKGHFFVLPPNYLSNSVEIILNEQPRRFLSSLKDKTEFEEEFVVNEGITISGKPCIKVEFRLANARSPKELGISDDKREIGIGLRSMRLEIGK